MFCSPRREKKQSQNQQLKQTLKSNQLDLAKCWLGHHERSESWLGAKDLVGFAISLKMVKGKVELFLN